MLQQKDDAQQICRLKRCTSAVTGAGSQLPRVKPFKYTYEKEIVMYAYYKKLDYFSTECIYAPYAARGLAREYVKDVELIRPSAIVDIIKSAEEMRYSEGMYPCCHLCKMAIHATALCQSSSVFICRGGRPWAQARQVFTMWIYLQPTRLQGVPPFRRTEHG